MTNVAAGLRRAGSLGVLNFIGLAVAFAALVLLSRLLAYEYSFDQTINPEGDVYRVGSTVTLPGRATRFLPGGYATTAAAIRARAPGWVAARAVRGFEPKEVRVGDLTLQAPVSSAEAEIDRVLRIRTLHGDLVTALSRPDGVALTASTAEQLFGVTRAVGRNLVVDGQALRVEAVIADWPRNSSFRDFRIILSGTNAASDIRSADAPREFSTSPGANVRVTTFGTVLTYVKAAGDPEEVRRRLNALADADIANQAASAQSFSGARRPRARAHSVPLSRANLVSEGARSAGEQGADPAALAALTALGMVLLVIASFNFVSVSATRAASRAKDIAIRKTFGATRSQLGLAALGRSIAVACGAAGAGVLLAFLVRGWFASLVGREISLLPTVDLALLILTAGVATGAAAGLLPMLTLTAPRPSVMLQTRAARAGRLRAILLGAQVVAASVSVTFGFVLAAQYRHLISDDTLNLRKDQVAFAAVAPANRGGLSEDRLRALVNRARSAEGVEASAVGPVPARGGLVIPLRLTRNDAPLDADAYEVSSNYFDVLRIQPLAGRLFGPSEAGSLLDAQGLVPIVLGEAATNRLGFSSPAAAVGATLSFASILPGNAQVIGVVPDISFSAERDARPSSTAFVAGYGRAEHLLIRAAPGRPAGDALAELVSSVSPEAARSVTTLSAAIAAKYADIGRLVGAISVLAALGLVSTIVGAAGLAASLSHEMAFEAAVRKSFGAGGGDIVKLFGMRVAAPIVGGAVIGVPMSLWAARAWLENYPERVPLGLTPSLASTALFASLIIGVLAWRGLALARLRPALILRQV